MRLLLLAAQPVLSGMEPGYLAQMLRGTCPRGECFCWTGLKKKKKRVLGVEIA